VLIISKKTKAISDKQYANQIEYWLNLKNKFLDKTQSTFLKEVNKVIGEYTYVNIELEKSNFCVYYTVIEFQRNKIDILFRNTSRITISKPIEMCTNLIQITFEV